MPKKKKLLSFSSPDWLLVGTVLFLTFFGLVMIANASAVEAFRDFGDKFYLFKLQAYWSILGLVVFWLISFFPYQKLASGAKYFLFSIFITLFLVLLPNLGFSIFGARRWLDLGFVRFQPAELTKLFFIIYLAAYLTKKKSAGPLLLVSGLIISLIMLQPDLGSTIVIIVSGFLVYFAAGASWWQILGLGFTGLVAGLALIFSSAYRRERVLTFLDPFRDPLGASYHIRQVLIALGSGGLFGVGLGQSRQKYEYLPAVATDSIFAVIGEETGFLGAALLVGGFLFLIWRGLKVAQNAPDQFGRLLSVGIISWLGIQAFVNLAAMVALVPLTGIPLPFISYGGSSLVLVLTGAGILVNISRQGK